MYWEIPAISLKYRMINPITNLTIIQGLPIEGSVQPSIPKGPFTSLYPRGPSLVSIPQCSMFLIFSVFSYGLLFNLPI